MTHTGPHFLARDGYGELDSFSFASSSIASALLQLVAGALAMISFPLIFYAQPHNCCVQQGFRP